MIPIYIYKHQLLVSWTSVVVRKHLGGGRFPFLCSGPVHHDDCGEGWHAGGMGMAQD